MTTTAAPASIKLYASASIPAHLIVDCDGDYFLVGAGGWDKRRPLPSQHKGAVASWYRCNPLVHGRSLGLPRAA